MKTTLSSFIREEECNCLFIVRHNWTCAIHCGVLCVMRCSLCGFSGFSFILSSQEEETFLSSVAIPWPWRSFGFKSLFGPEILHHGGHNNAYWERLITPSRDKPLPVRLLFPFSHLFLPGKCHASDVPTREMWVLTRAQVCQWCTDAWPLTTEIKAGHGVLNTHSAARNDPVLFYTWLMTS